MDDMTRSFESRDSRPGRDDDASAFSLTSTFDSEVVRGLGEEEFAANQADRVV